MQFLKEQGATKVICAISLPFFTGDAIKNFDEAYEQGLFYRIIGTNAVYHEDLLNREWYISTDVSGLFANVITRIHYNQSLSELLDNRSIIEKVVKQTTPNKATGNAVPEPVEGQDGEDVLRQAQQPQDNSEEPKGSN